jgi:hypothetical protein
MVCVVSERVTDLADLRKVLQLRFKSVLGPMVVVSIVCGEREYVEAVLEDFVLCLSGRCLGQHQRLGLRSICV